VVEVTADTNLYVSAFEFADLPYQLIQAAEDGRVRQNCRDHVKFPLEDRLKLPSQASRPNFKP